MEIRECLSCDPNAMSGAVVIKGSRVPVETLFAYISIDEFLENFPTISMREAEAVLSAALELLKREFPSRTI